MRNIASWILAVSIAVAQQTAPRSPINLPSATAQNVPVTFSGHTLDAKGEPLRKCTVTLRPMIASPKPNDPPPQPYVSTSDAQGKFSFVNIDPGRYTLFAEHAGYLRTNYGAKRNPNTQTILSLASGREVGEITIKLTEQAVISGQIMDTDNDVAARAQVQLIQQRYSNGRRQPVTVSFAITDDQGEFRISGLAAGRYYLRVEPRPLNTMAAGGVAPSTPAAPEQRSVTTFYPGALDLAAAAPLDLEAGQNVTGINFRLQRSLVYHVRGKIADVTGDMSKVRAVLMPRQGPILIMRNDGVIAKDGTFDLDGVTPGSYSLALLRIDEFQNLGQRPIEVGKQDLDGVVLTSAPLPDLHGSIKLEEIPKPAPGSFPKFEIMLTTIDGPTLDPPNAFAGEDGAFAIKGAGAGRYRVNVSGIPSGSFLKSVSYGGRDALDSGVELASGAGEASLQVVISGAAGAVDGTVNGDDDQPSAGGIVTLIPDPPRPEQTYWYQTASADQNGKFSFAGVRPGKYRVFAWEEMEPGGQFDPDFLKGHDGQGVAITVEENDRLHVKLTRISSAPMKEQPAAK